jgi:hypothetical protein
LPGNKLLGVRLLKFNIGWNCEEEEEERMFFFGGCVGVILAY